MRSILLALLLFWATAKPSDVTLHDLSGKKVQLKELRGKLVVLNFWATWCAPCRQEMPMLVEAEKTWAPKGVTFVAVSLDDSTTIGDIPAFLKKYNIDFPVWTGASSDELDKLHLGKGVPDTVFIDENGVIVARVLGQIRPAELTDRLTWLTGDHKSPPPPELVNHM